MGEIRVFWTDLRTVTVELYQKLLSQATPARRERALKYRQPADRLRSLAVGALLQKALDYAGVPPAQRAILPGDHGKPQLSGPAGEQVCFSLSHSGMIALCAIGASPLGADVERPRPHPPLDLIRRKCAPSEAAWLQEQPEPELAFFRLWVLKESYAKALGLGLRLPLNSYEIAIGPFVSVLRDGLPEPWRFREATLHGYPAAVCTMAALPCHWQQLPLVTLAH